MTTTDLPPILLDSDGDQWFLNPERGLYSLGGQSDNDNCLWSIDQLNANRGLAPFTTPAPHELAPELDAVEMVTATDGEREVVEMPRSLFESTYSRFGWTVLDTSAPDPQWPTEDPDDTGRGPFDAYLPAKETS